MPVRVHVFLLEMIVVAVVSISMGVAVSSAMRKLRLVEVPAGCAGWNEGHIMEIAIGLTAAMSHVFFEASGINAFYVRYKSSALGGGP